MRRITSLSAAVVLALAAVAHAATPTDELLGLVPEDVGFCLVFQDLRQVVNDVKASAFARQFAASPLGLEILNSPEVGKLAKAEKDVQTALNVSWTDLVNDVFGDAVVLAYRPGPPEQPEQEQGLF